MRVLLVEDDEALADVVCRALRGDGLAVDHTPDGREALGLIDVNHYDVLLLDRNLPGMHGDHVCREVVARRLPARILMLTAAGEIRDRVEGLDSGADDYLTKPFALSELRARVRALGRRASTAAPPVLRWADIELDPSRRRVLRGTTDVVLTRKEFGVLETLLLADGAVVSAEELLERVWDQHADPFTNAIRITIMTLRRKLGEPPVVETVVGAGYRLA
jgi:DNA-binding response OmpR family regulator